MNYFTFIFATVIGLAAIWMSIKFIRLYLKVKKWNRVNATVTSKCQHVVKLSWPCDRSGQVLYYVLWPPRR